MHLRFLVFLLPSRDLLPKMSSDAHRRIGCSAGAMPERLDRSNFHGQDHISHVLVMSPRNRSMRQSTAVLLLTVSTCFLSCATALELRRPSRQLAFRGAILTLKHPNMHSPSSAWLSGPRLRGGMALNVTADHVPANGGPTGAPANGLAEAGNFTVDELKIEALRKLGASLRIGGPGSVRRKFKVVRKKQSKANEARFQNALRRVGINPLNDIEEVQMYKNDGTVMTFDNPRVQANVHTNAYVITGSYQEQRYQDFMPAMGSGTNQHDMEKLRKLAQSALPTEQGETGVSDDVAGRGTAEDQLESAAEDLDGAEQETMPGGEEDGGSGTQEEVGGSEREAAVGEEHKERPAVVEASAA